MEMKPQKDRIARAALAVQIMQFLATAGRAIAEWIRPCG
jgi:hypothetical protein